MNQNQTISSVFSAQDEAARKAFWRAAVTGRQDKSLGAIPGTGENLLPQNLGRVLLTEPLTENPLRQLERVSQIYGLSAPLLNYTILDSDLEDVSDDDTANEIEFAASLISFDEKKTKIYVTLSDTVIHGSDELLSNTIEEALRSGLAQKELMNAFRTVPNGTNDHQSFYLNGIKTVTGPNLIQAIINALTDLPGKTANKSTVILRKMDYFNAVMCFNGGDLWGKKPEDVFLTPTVFCDEAVVPVIGDFSAARLNYSTRVIFEQDKDARAGLYFFYLTAWGDHRILHKDAFRLAVVAP